MKIYSYSRISTAQQSLDQQHLKVSEWLESKGLTLTADISDEGVSGKISYKQRNLAKLLDMMKEGDCLICSELSRLGRSMSDINKLVNDDLKPRKLRLVIVSMGIDLDCGRMSAIDELILANIAFSAQVEREMIMARVQAGHDAKKRQIKESAKFVNRRGELCIGGYSEQYGKRTGTTHAQALEQARAKRSVNMRQRAKENANNIQFKRALDLYEQRNGYIGANSDITPFTNELNNLGFKTATGLEFTNARARAMLYKVRELYLN